MVRAQLFASYLRCKTRLSDNDSSRDYGKYSLSDGAVRLFSSTLLFVAFCWADDCITAMEQMRAARLPRNRDLNENVMTLPYTQLRQPMQS